MKLTVGGTKATNYFYQRRGNASDWCGAGSCETFVIEDVLLLGGKRWAEGKEMLRWR
ncbi:MAG: hypothetical protein QNJ63_31650 [Calothrix sp. MO_192.B10]|nr:hypothetical protein [Calothrix sp. MO_192.B10]